MGCPTGKEKKKVTVISHDYKKSTKECDKSNN